MDFLVGLAVYLFLGSMVAYYAKNTQGQLIRKRNREYVFLFCTVIWPVLLFVMIGVWITGGYKKINN